MDRFDQYYKALEAKDSRFDGQFFVGVSSTGIYCRPVCRVTTPKKENCTFYDSHEQAEVAGYRPCLRCRPELAPKYSEFKSSENLIGELINYFEEQSFKTGLIKESSDFFGVSERHIHRLFKEELGVSPTAYIMTKRLLMAKMLLTDTSIPIGDVALQVGFGSVSRFNEAFKKHYRLVPSALRKNKAVIHGDITLNLSYRAPYNWERMMAFFKVRAIPFVEAVEGLTYRRTVRIEDGNHVYKGWIQAEPNSQKQQLQLTISESLAGVLIKVVKRVRQIFDLDLAPEHLPSSINQDIRLPGAFDPYEMCCRAILGQQITVKAATTLSGRMAARLGDPTETPFEDLTMNFPTVTDIISQGEQLESTLGEIGIIRTRSHTMLSLARSIDSGHVDLSRQTNSDVTREALMAIKGIGQWSADYMAMRALSDPDMFLVTDLGVKKALLATLKDESGHLVSDNKEDLSPYKHNKQYIKCAMSLAESYRPYRSYFNFSLWHQL